MDMMKWKFDPNKVRGRMVELGKTQKDLAMDIGSAPTSVWNKLNGKTAFTVDEVCDLATVLDVSPSIFFAPDMCEPHNN